MANPLHAVAGCALRALEYSARHGSVLLALGIFGGLAIPPLAAALHHVITPAVIGMTTLMLLRVDLARSLALLRRPGRVVGIVTVQMLACPVLAWAAVAALPVDPGIRAGVVLFSTGCAATSAAAFARMVGLDGDLSLVATLATLLLVPVTAPPIALWLLGIDLSIGLAAFMARLVLVVGLPLLLSVVLRRVIGAPALVRHGQAVDGAVVLVLLAYAFAVMDGVGLRLVAEPGWVGQGLLAAFAASYGINIITTLLLARWGLREAATAGLMGGNRNMALYLAVLPASTDPRITLFFGLCQFPLYLSPFLLRPVYRSLLAGSAAVRARQGGGRSRT